TLYLLPVSLFGLSVAASELPELARLVQAQRERFMDRVERSMRQVLFLTIPTFAGYVGLGFLIVGAFFQRGSFDLPGTWLVYLLLGGYTLGMPATTLSRLLQNSFYALGDTRTPARIAVLRVAVSTAVALPLMFWLDHLAVADAFGFARGETPLFLGGVGLALGATVGAWLELWRLQRALRRRVPAFGLPAGAALRMAGLALAALAPSAALWWLLPGGTGIGTALLVVGLYGAVFLGAARVLGLPELEAWAGRFFRRK